MFHQNLSFDYFNPYWTRRTYMSAYVKIDSSCRSCSSHPARHARWSGLWCLSYGGYTLVIDKLQFRYPGGKYFLYIYPCLKSNIHWFDIVFIVCVSSLFASLLFIFIPLIIITNGQKSASWHNCKCMLSHICEWMKYILYEIGICLSHPYIYSPNNWAWFVCCIHANFDWLTYSGFLRDI